MSGILGRLSGTPSVQLKPGPRGDVLILSMRNVANLVAFCFQYEFEDVIASLTGADRADLMRLDSVELGRKIYKALSYSSSSTSLALRATPKIGGLRLDRTYDLFLPIFNHAHEVFAVNAIPGWRQRCRYAACVISEAMESDLPEYLLESLAAFDHIYVGSRPVEAIQRITGRPCTYLPLAVDVLTFCPLPQAPPRGIDVLGIGRRSSVTHAALLDLARGGRIFYYYDTVRMSGGVTDPAMQLTFSVTDPAEHRFKLANLLMRSRYYIANRARANEYSVEFDELSGRFFEGAAAGAVMIGEPPRGERFHDLFDWPDSVVRAPFDAPDIGDLIAELDGDPERCTRIRRDNLVNALLRHDWAYRLRTILDDAGIAPPPALLAREARLRELAGMAKEVPIAP
jgi:Glycosyl transferases group 1